MKRLAGTAVYFIHTTIKKFEVDKIFQCFGKDQKYSKNSNIVK